MSHLSTTFNQPPDYHWSPANQRAFLEHLAATGNISEAAASVAMSTQAAYAFRSREAGAVFKLGWDAAVLLARARVEGDLLERALAGQEEIYERDADSGRVRRIRSDNRLSMSVLHRLDKMAAGKNDVPAETLLARIASQDFDAFLDLVERDGGRGEAMLFLKVRDDGLVPMVNVTREELSNNYQLAQNSAVLNKDEQPESTRRKEAGAMSVWYCEYSDGWRTNFPPPPDFCGEEEGEFGEIDYERDLSDDEDKIREEKTQSEIAPLRAAGEAARRAWFGLEQDAPTPFALSLSKDDGAAQSGFDKLSPNGRIDNQPCVEHEAQIMDFCVQGHENREGENEVEPEIMQMEPEADIEYKSNGPIVRPPPDDPNIRVIHCKPQLYYPGADAFRLRPNGFTERDAREPSLCITPV